MRVTALRATDDPSLGLVVSATLSGARAGTHVEPAAARLITPPGVVARGAKTVSGRTHLLFWLPAASMPQTATVAVRLATRSATTQVSLGKLSAAQLSTLNHEIAAATADCARQLLAAQRAGRSTRALRASIAALRTLSGEVSTLGAATATPAVEVAQTAPALAQELAPLPGLALTGLRPAGVPVLTVNPAVRYQQFAGLGAALTDSAAWLIEDELPAGTRAALLQALFGSSGGPNPLGIPDVHLSLLRIAIGSSGAMTLGAPYSYDDEPAGTSDPDLARFSIAHDLAYTIPVLQQALATNPGLSILGSVWSPPAWMKTNDALDNPDGDAMLLPSMYGTLAAYFVKFIEAYRAQGIPIAALTPENEPSDGNVMTKYPGLTMAQTNESHFITRYLEPALHAAGLGTAIFGGDLAWQYALFARELTRDAAGPDLAGIAWHCYFGNPTVMTQLQQSDPGLNQIVDECSPEIRSFGTPESLISALRNDATEYAVWTVALDPTGGPIQPGNACGGCRGPITIDESSGTVTARPEYYQLAQVATFVQPGAWRIDSPSLVSYGTNAADIETISPGLDDVAFQNPDGSLVLVAYDNSAKPITFAVGSAGRYFTYTIPAHAMTTFTW